jgi:nicotinic acid mononucleotide adenylyltransferase
MNISSTQIRESISKGRIPGRHLDKKVIEYIKEHKLYGYTGK